MMPTIPPEQMGDVRPAVQPGQSGDYGHARLDPSAPVAIRSFQTFTVTYTVGRFGLDDTGAIRIACRFVQDGGPWQTSDPSAPNYITARASNGVRLVAHVQPYAERPWLVALRVTVAGGYMEEGDTIAVVFGDRTGGSPGYLMQTICESAFQFQVSVDACATGQFTPLPDVLAVPIVPGPPVNWVFVAPTHRRPDEPFALGLRAEDRWGNPAIPGAVDVSLECDGPVDGLPHSIRFPSGERSCRIDGLSAPEGTYRFTARIGPVQVTSNPLVIAKGAAGYWGDLHGQSGETVGIGTIEEYLEFARDLAFLDVTGHQGNDFQMTDAFWRHLNATTAAMNQDDKFIVFPGYEWSGNTPVGGDHNVFFREEGRTMRRSSHAMMHDRARIDDDANDLETLFQKLADEDCVLWSHVGGRPADVSRAHDARMKTAVEVHSNWGTFEWILLDSLALGHRVGVVSNSDGHKGRPGAGGPGATEFGAYGGLTCFLAPRLTRDDMFQSMRRRHHYGTTGSRVYLNVSANGPFDVFDRDPQLGGTSAPADHAIMGDIVRTDDDVLHLTVKAVTGSPIERIEIMNGAACVATRLGYDADDLGHRVRVIWQGAEYRGRGRNTLWRGSVGVQGANVARMVPVNHWNLDRRLEVQDNRLVFEAVTSGNFAGADLWLDGPARLNVATNLVSGDVDLRDMGVEDHVLDAGKLGRQFRVRRLPEIMSRTEMKIEAKIPLAAGDNPIWVRMTTEDGHLAWSSPIYALKEAE